MSLKTWMNKLELEIDGEGFGEEGSMDGNGRGYDGRRSSDYYHEGDPDGYGDGDAGNGHGDGEGSHYRAPSER